jgi:hypothetical protein
MPVGTVKITQLMPYVLPGQRYGDFSGRTPAAPSTVRRPTRLTTMGAS